MAYAIGFCLPIVGIIGLIAWIGVNLKREADLDNFIKKHNSAGSIVSEISIIQRRR